MAARTLCPLGHSQCRCGSLRNNRAQVPFTPTRDMIAQVSMLCKYPSTPRALVARRQHLVSTSVRVLACSVGRQSPKCCPHKSHAVDKRGCGSTCASSGPSVLWDSNLRNPQYIKLALSLHGKMSTGSSSTSPHRRASATSSQNWRSQGFASAETEPSPAN